MSYIGRSPQIGGYHKLDQITTDGSASYTMQLNSGNFVPESPNHLIVSVNGVIQAPTDSFTVSGSTITFASTLSVSDTIDFIMALGNVLDIGTPSDSTVSLSKLTATGTKDATTFLRGDNTFATISAGITEADQWRLTANIDSNIDPISSNLERVDTGNFAKIGTGMSVSSGVWSFPSTGLYQVVVTGQWQVAQDLAALVYTYVSTDSGSNWTFIGTNVGGHQGTNFTMCSSTSQNFINVTNASTFRVKFATSNFASTDSLLQGSTSANETTFTFIRLGDSQ